MITDGEKIDALARKAREAKMSYGKFISLLSDTDKEFIYEEYEDILNIRKQASVEREAVIWENRTARKRKKTD